MLASDGTEESNENLRVQRAVAYAYILNIGLLLGALAVIVIAGPKFWHYPYLFIILLALAVFARYMKIEVQQNLPVYGIALSVWIAAVVLSPADAAIIGILLVLIGEFYGPVVKRIQKFYLKLENHGSSSSWSKLLMWLLEPMVQMDGEIEKTEAVEASEQHRNKEGGDSRTCDIKQSDFDTKEGTRRKPIKWLLEPLNVLRKSKRIEQQSLSYSERQSEKENEEQSTWPVQLSIIDEFVNIAWFALIAGLLFHYLVGVWNLSYQDPFFYLLFLGAFALALAINFGYAEIGDAWIDRYSFGSGFKMFTFLIPTEIVTAGLGMGVVYVYFASGSKASALFLMAIGLAVILSYYWHAQNRKVAIEREAFNRLTSRVKALHKRDKRTGTHCAAIALYVYEIACSVGLSTKQCFRGYRAGLVHDVGKTSWPGPLLDGTKGRDEITEVDRLYIKDHPNAGADRILGAGFKNLSQIIRCHHENLDGSGYPRGFQDHEIPELAKIIRVADTYDVITARDTYQSRRSREEAIAELRSKPELFEQRYVEALVKALEKDPELNYRHEDRRTYEEAIDFYTAGLLRKKRPPKHGHGTKFPHGAAEPTGRESVVKGSSN